MFGIIGDKTKSTCVEYIAG